MGLLGPERGVVVVGINEGNTKIGGRQLSMQTGDVATLRLNLTGFRGGPKQSSFLTINKAADTCGRCQRPFEDCMCDVGGSSSSSSGDPPAQRLVEEPISDEGLQGPSAGGPSEGSGGPQPW